MVCNPRRIYAYSSPGFKPRTPVPLHPLLPQITPESGIAGWTVS